MPIYKKVNKDFFKKWSHDMAYVLGFFAADGNMVTSKRGACFISIQLIDKDIVYAIRDVMGSDHTVGMRIRSGNASTMYRLQIGSQEIYADLEALGFLTNKTKRLVIPDIPKKFFWDFIRGYFDGDGNVWIGYGNKHRKTPTRIIQVAFTSVSKNFLEDVKNKLNLYGLSGGSLYSHTIKNYSRLSFVNRNALKIYKMMYNTDTTLFLSRKKEIFEKYIAAVVQR